MTQTVEYYVKEFEEGLLEQQRAIRDLSKDRSYIRKQEKRYSRAVDKLRESEEGVEAFSRLLSHDEPVAAVTAAVYLLKTSAESKAVETLQKYAKGPEEAFHASCARLRLTEWQKHKAQKR